MRVCFDGLCFASKRPATDEETQTVVHQCDGVTVNVNHLTPPSTHNSFKPLTTSDATVVFGDSKDKDQHHQHQQQQPHNSTLPMQEFNNSKMDIGSEMLADSFLAYPRSNNNPDNNPIAPNPNYVVNDRLNNLCLGEDQSVNLNPKEKELLEVIQLKNVRITELENVLRHKEVEVAELKSQLDKFQSVFPFSRGRKTGANHGVQRQRAQGISAEPQSESSILELLQVTFPKYDKEEK